MRTNKSTESAVYLFKRLPGDGNAAAMVKLTNMATSQAEPRFQAAGCTARLRDPLGLLAR